MMGGGLTAFHAKLELLKKKPTSNTKLYLSSLLTMGEGGGIYKIGYYVTQIFLNHGGYLQCGGGVLTSNTTVHKILWCYIKRGYTNNFTILRRGYLKGLHKHFLWSWGCIQVYKGTLGVT